MDATTRLRIATRIHFSLKRQFGENIEISTLLRSEPDAREAMWVCEASGDPELMSLAQQFARASVAVRAPEAKPMATHPTVHAAGRVPQDTAWSQDISGFGLSRPTEIDPPRAGNTWTQPVDWLRRGTTR